MVGGPCADAKLVSPYDDIVRTVNIETIIAILVFVIANLALPYINLF